MNLITKCSIWGISIVAFSGCVGQPSFPNIDETEVSKYEKNYMDEYKKLNNIKEVEQYKWIQASNKKEDCKLFIGYNPNDDRTQKIDYKIFWDGQCKNGYAYGLGREFEKALMLDMEVLAVYNGGEKEPSYYYQSDKLNNMTIEGNLNERYAVQTIIQDDGINFDIKFRNAYHDKNSNIMYLTEKSLFSDNLVFMKGYPNFTYVIEDLTNNEFDNRKYEFNLKDKNGNLNGYSFISMKDGNTNAGEFVDGALMRRVQLPESYFQNADRIFSEIKNAVFQVQTEQQKASMLRIQYKNKICKDDVKVNFMDNEEYKAICNENKKIAELKIKIDAKLAQLEKQKESKRNEINQQRLIQARETEAAAAQKKANAAVQANYNQSIQNLNNNLQMQQLNNNLMMYNLMPKTHNVYIH